MADRELLAKRLCRQSVSCRSLGSELYGVLLERAAEDVEAGGPTLDVLAPFAGEPRGSALALKLMGAVHRLVLEHEATELALYYPSVGGDADAEGAWPAFRSLLEARGDDVRRAMQRNVQTNEVGRCAGLLGGFLDVAERSRLPLRLLEVGCSAGLNLRWDHYRYEAGHDGWGDEESPVVLRGFASPPDLDRSAVVVERAGCDPDPIDPTTRDGRLTLSSYVWPDQHWRWEQLRGALAVAAEVPAPVDPLDAPAFLERELARTCEGVATVVYHSIVFQYLPPDQRRRMVELILESGARATDGAPLAWLRMEPPLRDSRWVIGEEHEWEPLFPDPEVDEALRGLALVHLTTWPGGETRVIAHCGYHGRPIHNHG